MRGSPANKSHIPGGYWYVNKSWNVRCSWLPQRPEESGFSSFCPFLVVLRKGTPGPLEMSSLILVFLWLLFYLLIVRRSRGQWWEATLEGPSVHIWPSDLMGCCLVVSLNPILLHLLLPLHGMTSHRCHPAHCLTSWSLFWSQLPRKVFLEFLI